MPVKDFNSRRDKILELIIDSYIDTAMPIASRTISRKLRLSLSPATIRNIMSDLEEMGLITHPHTSAGRIPTEKGYRYYIDKLMQARLLTEEEKKNINKEFKTRVNELDNILSKTSKIISSITSQTGMVLFPILHKGLFEHIELIKINGRKLLAILVTRSGMAEDAIINTDYDIEESELLRISNFINSQMGKGSLSSVRKDIMQRLIAERDSFFYVLEKAKSVIDSVLNIIDENKIYLDGRAHITEQPEFMDIDRLKNIFKILEDEDLLLKLLKRDMEEEGMRVHIGSELESDFAGFSLITSGYCIGDIHCGTLGIIGPTRMDYPKLMPMVGYIASTLSKTLSER